MGNFAEATICIYFDKVEDADKVHELLNTKPTEETFKKFLGEKGAGNYEFYEFEDNGSQEVYFKLSSGRVQNAEWQVERIIELLKHLVKTGEISGVSEFTGDIMEQGESYYCESDEFEPDEDEGE